MLLRNSFFFPKHIESQSNAFTISIIFAAMIFLVEMLRKHRCKKFISSSPRRSCPCPPFLNIFLDSFYLVVFDVDLVPTFAAPGMCTVVHGIFLDSLKLPRHHWLMHKDLVPYNSVPLVVPTRQQVWTKQ